MKNIIIAFLGLLLIFSIAFNYSFYRYINTHDVSTDSIVKVDTLWLDTIIKDSVPKPCYTTIIKQDTVYKKENDTIKAIPLFIKKKAIKIQ